MYLFFKIQNVGSLFKYGYQLFLFMVVKFCLNYLSSAFSKIASRSLRESSRP